jgi:carboxyl-terminal processing protease
VGRSIQKDYNEHADGVALLEDEDAISPDGEPIPEANDTTAREPYRTSGGRVVYGGGGIVPDLTVRPDTVTTAERDFYSAAARAGSAYADVLFRFTVDFVRANPNLRPDFVVTPAMRSDFFQRLQRADVQVTPAQFEAAQRLIDRDLAWEITLNKFGRSAAIQRRNHDNPAVRTAADLLRSAATQQALFQMAQTRRQASR